MFKEQIEEKIDAKLEGMLESLKLMIEDLHETLGTIRTINCLRSVLKSDTNEEEL